MNPFTLFEIFILWNTSCMNVLKIVLIQNSHRIYAIAFHGCKCNGNNQKDRYRRIRRRFVAICLSVSASGFKNRMFKF